MSHLLEYHRVRTRLSRWQRFVLGSGVTFAFGLAANLLPYWETRDHPLSDGIQYAGFPFEFYQFGGFVPHTVWHPDCLMWDILIVAIGSLAIGAVSASGVAYWLVRRLSP